MFLILPKTSLTFFSWPKFDEDCWNYHMIPVHSRATFIFPSGKKRNGKIVSDCKIFAFLAIILPFFGYYFVSVLKIDTSSLTCECSCILCPKFENFCPNNGQFCSVGDATASPASPCRTLMSDNIPITFCWIPCAIGQFESLQSWLRVKHLYFVRHLTACSRRSTRLFVCKIADNFVVLYLSSWSMFNIRNNKI